MKYSKKVRKYYHMDKHGNVNYASAGNEDPVPFIEELLHADVALQELLTNVEAAKIAALNGANPAKLLDWIPVRYNTPLKEEARFDVEARSAELESEFREDAP